VYVRTKVNRCQRSRYSGGYSSSAIAGVRRKWTAVSGAAIAMAIVVLL